MDDVHQIAARIFGHDCFDMQCRDYCKKIPQWFRSDPRRLAAFGDLGRVMTVIAALAGQTEQGVTLATISGVVSAMNYASARRIRAICDNFVRIGLITRGAGHADHRKRPLLFGGWFEEALLGWLDIVIATIRPWMEWRPKPDRATLYGMIRFSAARITLTNPFQSWGDVRTLLDRVAGYPFLLDLVGATSWRDGLGVSTISRKKMAAYYSVSRPHVAGLIAQCEHAGWLIDTGGALTFPPSGFNRVRLWIATEFAAVKLALDVFCRPAGL